MNGKMEPEIRYFAREFSFDSTGRTVKGIAVPWDSPGSTREGTPELFIRGATGPPSDFLDFNLTTFHERAFPVSGDLAFTDEPDGLHVEARIAETTRGNDTITEIRSGILRGFSVEFHALRERQADGVRVIERAMLVGLSLVDVPAYAAAAIEEIRQKEIKENPQWRPRVWL